MKVPAWQVQTGSCTTPGWVYILTPERDAIGWPRTRCVDALLPIDPEEQRQLAEITPAWMEGGDARVVDS